MARMDIDYEYDDLEIGKKPKKTVVIKKGGWLGKIVALFLGVIIGIVAGIGGLVGAGYYIATQVKIKDAADTVSGLTGLEIPLSDYLSDEYAELTLLGVIDGTVQTVSKISAGEGTLNDLNAISPFVGNYIKSEGGLIDTLVALGIDTSAEELMSRILVKTVETEDYDDTYLSDYLMLKIDEIPFSKLVETVGFDGNELITTLTYGVEGVDYKIQNGEYVMLGDSTPLTIGGFLSAELDVRIEKLPLDAVMDDPQDEIMKTLFYGPAHRYAETPNGVIMNQVFYTYDGTNFYDDNGEKLSLSSAIAQSEENDEFLLTFQSGTKQTVKKSAEGDKFLAFTTDKEPQIIRFKKTTIGDLEGEAEALINNITLESALKLNDDSHSILKAIAYDGETKRTIKDLREKGSDLINEVSLSDVIPIDVEDKIVMYLLYGKENVHYAVDAETGAITPLQKRVALYGGKVYNEYGELIENATPNGTKSYSLNGKTYDLVADASLGTVQVKLVNGETTTTHDATLYYVRQNGENLYYAPTTIGDMQNADVISKLTGRLRLKDVMDVGENKLLKHLAEESIDDLPEAINALTIDDVFGEHFYYRAYNPATGTYTSYRENGNHQPIDNDGNLVVGAYFVDINNNNVDINSDGVVSRDEADRALTGTWKYLLMERKADGTFTINHQHTIVEIDGIMDHMSDNVHAATVRELKLDGIVKNIDNATLNKVIIGKMGSTEIKIEQNRELVRVDNLDGDLTDEDHIGDLTVEQLMLYMGAMLDILSA